METTPKSLNKKICTFLELAGLLKRPSYLPFTEKSTKYEATRCLENCESESDKNKCDIVYGWIIWENRSTQFIEAEFHAVIKDGNQLVDITPRLDKEEKVLFVPDPRRTATRIKEVQENKTLLGWNTWRNIVSQKGIITQQTVPIDIINTIITQR